MPSIAAKFIKCYVAFDEVSVKKNLMLPVTNKAVS